MAKGLAILRYFLFCIFFFVAASAIAISILAEELATYYNNRLLQKQILEENQKINRLISRYDDQIQQIKTEPNILSMLEPITFGSEPEGGDISYPRASTEQLIAAHNALLEDINTGTKPDNTYIARWIHRSTDPKNRKVIFFTGAALMIITFIFFGTPGPIKQWDDDFDDLDDYEDDED